MEHDADNNQLARIYLNSMYNKALEYDVPLWPKQRLFTQINELVGIWEVDPQLQGHYDALMHYYQRYPDLRKLHKRWRQLVLTLAARAKMNADQLKPSFLSRISSVLDNTRAELDLNALHNLKSYRERDLKNLLGEANLAAFMNLVSTFYDKYVHKSAFPWNTTTGMWPQFKTTQILSPYTGQQETTGIYHRQIYTTRYTDFRVGNRTIHNVGRIVGPVLGATSFFTGPVVASLVDYDIITPKPFKDGKYGK